MAEDGLYEIDGKPGVMSNYSPGPGPLTAGPLVDAAVNAGPEEVWTVKHTMGISDMMEGQDFYVRDREATQNLMNFVHLADRGFEAYTDRAKLAGEDYLASDDAGRAAIAKAAPIGNIAENVG